MNAKNKQKPISLTVRGVILLSLPALLIACSGQPEVIKVPVTRTVVEKVYPPSELLVACPAPELDSLETSGDLEAAASDALIALTKCDADKRKLREWAESQ